MGFLVRIFDDQTSEQINNLVGHLQDNREELACLALFILTHGEENLILHSHNSSFRLDKHIVDRLTPSDCPSLAGKPKLVFVQACQGKEADEGAEVRVRSRHTSTDGASSASYRIPHHADFLIFQAAYHGHYSFRSSSGSWFVQALCQAFAESKEEESINM